MEHTLFLVFSIPWLHQLLVFPQPQNHCPARWRTKSKTFCGRTVAEWPRRPWNSGTRAATLKASKKASGPSLRTTALETPRHEQRPTKTSQRASAAKGRIRPKAFPTQKESWRMLAKNPVTCQCLRPSLWQAARPNQNSPPAERAGQSLSHVICTWPKVCVLKDSAFQKTSRENPLPASQDNCLTEPEAFPEVPPAKKRTTKPAAHSLKNAKKMKHNLHIRPNIPRQRVTTRNYCCRQQSLQLDRPNQRARRPHRNMHRCWKDLRMDIW